MKKISISIIFIIISSFLTSNVLPEAGIGGLIDGVNLKNSPVLFLSEFIIISMILFNNLGKCEKYLYGFGKYQLLRHKDRQLLMIGIYAKTLAYICFLTLSRIFVYIVLLILRDEKSDISVSNTINYAVMCILTFILLSLIQHYIELNYSSSVGLVITMIYYLFSISFGGILAEKEVYFPIVLLLPNYYMKNRSEAIIRGMGINEWLLYFILILSIFSLIALCRRAIKKKDIF